MIILGGLCPSPPPANTNSFFRDFSAILSVLSNLPLKKWQCYPIQNRKQYFLDNFKAICWMIFLGKIKEWKCAWPAQLIGIPVYQSCFWMCWNNRELKPQDCFKPCWRCYSCFTCISISSPENFLLLLRKLQEVNEEKITFVSHLNI